jgi:hypothetical protein
VGRVTFKKGDDPLGWQPCLRTPLMHRVLPPSEPPDGERPRYFRLAVVGGAQLRGSWYLSAIARLQGFSSGSPAASPCRWSPKTVTTSLMVGRSKPGCGLCPALSFKDLHHPCWGGGRGEPGPAFAWAGVPLLPPASGGGNHPPALQRRCPPAMPGKANCCCPARVQHSVLCPGDGGQPHRGVSQHVVRREGCTRVLGRSHSRFHGEDGSEDLPVRFGAAGTRWCGVCGQVDAAVGAEVVAAGESFSADETISATRGLTSDSLALISGSRPLSGDTNESLPMVASVLGPSLLLQRSLASRPEFVVPQALRCGGCSYPREWNRSSVCNDTLSVGVCSLWLSGPEHVCIWA